MISSALLRRPSPSLHPTIVACFRDPCVTLGDVNDPPAQKLKPSDGREEGVCGCHDCDDVTVPETVCFHSKLEEEKKARKRKSIGDQVWSLKINFWEQRY